MSRLGELWKNLPSDEIELYKARAETEKFEMKREWERQFELREEVSDYYDNFIISYIK